MSDENDPINILIGLAAIGAVIFVVVTILSAFMTYWALTSPIARIWSAQSNPIIIFGISFIFVSFVVFGLLSGLVGGGTTHQQPQSQPTTTEPTSETYETDPEPDNLHRDVLDEDWSQDTTGYNPEPINIDETPGRSRTDYPDIDTDVGSDEPRISDRRNQGYSGKAYSEEDDEDLSNLDVDLDDI